MDDTDQAGDAAGDEPAPEAGDQPAGKTGADDEFRALAEDWIAIWQSEITAYLTDPETLQAWAAMMAIWAGAAQTMMRSVPPTPGFGMRQTTRPRPAAPRPAAPRPAATTREPARKPGPAQSSRADAAPRPAPAASASVARDDEIRRLEQRVADLERHLADERRRGATGDNRRTRRTGRPRG